MSEATGSGEISSGVNRYQALGSTGFSSWVSSRIKERLAPGDTRRNRGMLGRRQALRPFLVSAGMTFGPPVFRQSPVTERWSLFAAIAGFLWRAGTV